MSVRMVARFVYVRVWLLRCQCVLFGALYGSRVLAVVVLQEELQRGAWCTPRLRLASAVCTGLRDSCCGEPLAEGYNNAQNCAYAAAG